MSFRCSTAYPPVKAHITLKGDPVMMPTLTDKEFLGFKQMMFELAGIHISEAKKPLVSGRLAKRLGQHGLDSYGDYLSLVQNEPNARSPWIC